jgi:hypothetical protein
MTKQQAQKKLLEFCKKGIRWYDQGMGHGHHEFHLEPLELYDFFDAIKACDGKVKNARKRRTAPHR